MKNNILLEKSYKFSIRIIRLYQHISKLKKEYVLSKQILRSGTSIGANIEETIGAQSIKDFRARLSIAYREARETNYWLRLLRDSGYITDKQAESVLKDCEELLKIIGSIQSTLKKKVLIRNS